MVNNDEGSFSSLTSILGSINSFIFEKNKKITYIVALLVIPAFTYAVFSWEASDKADLVLGSDAIDNIINGNIVERFDYSLLSDYTEQVGVSKADDELKEGGTASFTVESSSERLIRNIVVSVRWTDETSTPGIRIRPYDNKPDSFRVTIDHPDGNRTVIGEADSGSISDSINFTDEDIERMYNMGNFTIAVTLVEAGDWEAGFGFGIRNMPDDGNTFDIEIEQTFLAPKVE